MQHDELEAIANDHARRQEAEAVPFPGPAPIGDKQSWRGNWQNSRAVGPESWGHVALGDRRFPSRAAMLIALEQARVAKLFGRAAVMVGR